MVWYFSPGKKYHTIYIYTEMNSEEIRTITLRVNGKEAEQVIKKTVRNVEEWKRRLTEIGELAKNAPLTPALMKEADSLRRKIAEGEKSIRRYGTTAEEMGRIMDNLSGSTMKELRSSLKTLNALLNSGKIERGSKEWETVAQAIRATKEEMKHLKEEMNAAPTGTGGMLGKIADFGSAWSGTTYMVKSAFSLYSQAMDQMQQYVDAYASVDAAMAAVEKYTGLARSEVEGLNEAFRHLDTTTSIEGLNALAADAGRLGINSREQILQFVEAADQINTALGEELGEGAVKNIGKLAQLFGDADRMGLKQAMLATGSAINELAQSSSASEGYIMDFTARLAGVGRQAGLTQAEVMGFASVLDQGMVGVEKGATAMQNVLTLLNSKTREMALVAGMNVKEFTELLRTDANEAVLQFVEALNRKGGFDALAQKLTEMHMSGSGVTQTLSTLANNIGTLRETQQQATKAFEEGNSVTIEAQKASSTLEARLQKEKEKMHLLAAELGKSLYPAYLGAMKGVNWLGEAFKTSGAWIMDHLAVLTATATAIGVLTVAYKAHTIWQTVMTTLRTAYTAATTAATAATAAFTLALNSNGITAAISAVLALVAAVASYLAIENLVEEQAKKNSRALNAQAKETDALQRARQKAVQGVAEETAKVEQLERTVHNANLTYEERNAALQALKRLVPQYHAVLTREGKLERDNVEAIREYIEALSAKAEAEAIYEELVEQKKRTLAARRRMEAKQNNVERVQATLDTNPQFAPKPAAFNRQVETNLYRIQKQKEMAKQQAALNKEEAAYNKEREAEKRLLAELNRPRLKKYAAQIGTENGTLGVTAVSEETEETPAERKAREKRERAERAEAARRLRQQKQEAKDEKDALEARYLLQQVALDEALDGRIISEQEYRVRSYALQWAKLDEEMKLYKEGSKEQAEVRRQQLELQQKETELAGAWSLQDLERQTEEEKAVAKKRYLEGTTSEKAYQEELKDIRRRELAQRINLLAEQGKEEEAQKARQELANLEEERMLKERNDFWKQVEDFRKEYLKKTDEETLADKRAFAKKLLELGLITKEEYERIIRQLKEKPADLGSGGEWATAFTGLYNRLSELRRKVEDGTAGWQDYAAAASSALQGASTLAGSFSQLYAAQMQEEQAKVENRYAAEIEAAGQGSKRAQKLEEQKQKELAKIKSKYAKKQQRMEILQATASTAQNAIAAFGSQFQPSQPWTLALAIAAAALATAQGAVQIAIIKKQHAAQAAGYYKGGFTGGTDYRREAGVVHQGEFVANHLAVQNPAIAPVLRLIDHAQRTNTVAALTPQDITRTVIHPMQTATGEAAAPTLPSSGNATDFTNDAAHGRQPSELAEAIRRLNENLETGIRASVAITGDDGFERQWNRYQKQKKNI